MDPTTRYTTDQVVAGIQAFVREHVDEKLEIDPDASVDDYSSAIVKGYGCPLEFLWELSEYFGLRWDDTRWSVWLRLQRARRGERISKRERQSRDVQWREITSQSITVRQLATYIARHARGVSMQPVAVFGKKCAPAGAFRGLCELPEVRGKRVGPSTRLRSVMGAQKIAEFWQRAAWVSGAKLPRVRYWDVWKDPLPAKWMIVAGLGYPMSAVALGAAADHLSLPFVAAMAIASVFLAVAWCISDRLRNPLPEGIETFGDLARLIANPRG